MEMWNRTSGNKEPIGPRTIDQLKQYRLRLFNLIISIYSITQKDNDNNWLFECKEHKVRSCKKTWRAIFVKSLGKDFDFNKRWLEMPKERVTGGTSSSSKKGTRPPKRKLPNKRDYKGGKKEMAKNKKIFDKAAKEEKRKMIAAAFPGINIEIALKNGPCPHYDRYNKHVRSGADWDPKLIDDEMMRLSSCNKQTMESGDRFSNKVIKIQRYPLKFTHSRSLVDIVQLIKNFIESRFRLDIPN